MKSQEALNAFVSGPIKKSKFVKEKEAAEAKKREEEELASKAYADFVAAFDGNDKASGRSRGGGSTITHQGRIPSGPAFVSAAGAPWTAAKPDLSGELLFPAISAPESVPVSTPKSAVTTVPTVSKKLKAGESFLEELKRKDAEREGRLAAKASKDPRGMSITALAALETAPYLSGGSRDTGDPLTTNVHVGNLPGTISEQSLGAFCVKWGPIASLKIMWPRSGSDNIGGAGYGMVAMRQNKSGGLNGFVSYMRRSDAERACRELDGFDWGGHILRTGWGKAMPMPPGHKPQFELPRESRVSSRSPSPGRRRYGRSPSRRRRRSRSLSDSHSYPSRSRSRSRPGEDRTRPFKRGRRRYDSRSCSRSPSSSRSRISRSMCSSDYSRSRSRERREWPRLPGGEEEERFIRTVAKKVLEHGERFERTLRERERLNTKFNFLVEGDTAAYHFFRMLIDRHYRPPSPPPPPFGDEGYASIYSTDSAEESENERLAKGKLGKYSRKRFQAMLRSLTPQREKIARCMAFALHHADAADEVAEILAKSLMIDSTPVPRKLARLYVMSDVLHNSSNSLPNAWKYRQVLEKLLPDVFDHLNLIYRSFPGRIKAETFKKQVCAVINVWSSFMVFSQNSIDDFNSRLVQMDDEDEVCQQALDGDDVSLPVVDIDENVDGVAAEDTVLNSTADDNAAPTYTSSMSSTRAQSGFTKAFKPAVMEASQSTPTFSSASGVKLVGAIKLPQ